MDKPVTIWWSPGEPEDDLHGFVTKAHRDACDAGESGPFLRIVRNHHKYRAASANGLSARKRQRASNMRLILIVSATMSRG